MAIPNPYPNIADDVKSDVTTYSSNKIESLISAATELPIPAAGDEGKVLTVNAGATGYELDAIPSELPATELSDAGKVLAVNAAGDGYELDTPVDPTSIIDDTASATTTVYSSDKVDTLLSGKADAPIVSAYTDFGYGTGIDSASSSVSINKIGKLVFVRGYLKIGENGLADGDSILTGIPARTGARNDNTFPLEISAYSQLGTASMQACWIDSSANLNIAGAGTASNYILLNFSYLSA